MTAAAAAALVGLVGAAQANHLLFSDVAGHTTLERSITGPDPSSGYATLHSEAVNGSYVVRDGVSEGTSAIPAAPAGRAGRRRSLFYFSQLTDFQLADEESPARVEFLDPTSDQDPSHFAESAWRPQEALHPQMIDRAIDQINRFVPQSPVAQGDGTRASMDIALTTGDSADNMQRNETSWTVKLLEGGLIDPNSGSSNPADYAACPPGTPGPGEGARYTGVQDYGDYVEGPNPDFYDPDDPRGAFSGWPRYHGLMDRAQQPFQAVGLDVPSYVTLGNHDGLVQGNAAANRGFEDVATGCQKEVAPSQQITDLQSAIQSMTPAYLTGLAQTDPNKVALVPPDANRQFVSTVQYKALHAAGQPDAHGFAFVDDDELANSNGAAAYYAWSPKPGLRFIALNTVGEGGIVSDQSSAGNIDEPQFRWLEGQLQAASARDELIVLFGHHAINSLNNKEPDEAGPPCTGVFDPHGHDLNPGCDVDPRSSTPLHLGEPSQRPPGDTTETLSELLTRNPHVIAYVAGHSHVNQVLFYPRSDGTSGFWNIKTAAEADWPSQSRLLEVLDNDDGTLSIFGTIIDHSAATATPAPNTPANGFNEDQLASLNREFAYNDPQKGAGTGEGQSKDRNVELLLRDPRTAYARPKGATPTYASLVPAYRQCGASNRQHGPPLAFSSCASPTQESSQLTVGSPDSNGRVANSIGFMRFDVVPGNPATPADEADVAAILSITDVRRQADLADYTGELQANVTVRITDRNNSASPGGGNTSATAVDFAFPVNASCAATTDASIGGLCAATTSFDAIVPGAIKEGKRAIWQLGQVEVSDGGSDGLVGTNPNTVFARQGIFVP
jgi:hypothetical protein